MTALAWVLMLWIASVSPLPLPDEAPRVGFMGEWTMRCMAWDQARGECGPETAAATPEIQAFYDPLEKMIYLRWEWSPWTVRGLATLVHELVHHMQFAAGLDKTAECKSALETDAYRLQNQWTALWGQPIESDALFMVFVSMCHWDAR